ncbi:MAG: hypothetical protein [Caudoviricetes sp.]|nr:MAG: hypothetical protein [Caudoviricetes sp.]
MATGCGDVVSLEDLKTAKLHQVFEAEVITGLSGGAPGGSNIDYATNPVTGQVQKTMPAILRDLGFSPASFDFTTGGTLSSNDRGKAVLWTIASGGDGDWYYWEGALPKVIPASSSPASTGGVSDGAWRPVGDIKLRSQISNINSAVLYPELHRARWKDTGDIRAFSPVGDGVTDDTAVVNSAIASFGTTAGKLYFPKNPDGTQRRYLVNWASIVNPYGVQFVGPGSLVSPESVGGLTQRNLYGNQFKISYGHEYLYRVYKRFELNQTANIFLFGDSTMQGGNGEDAAYSTGALVFDIFQAAGLNINVVNRGVAGTSWYQMNALPDVSATSDLFIIKYGINDGGTPGSGDRFANYANALRAKLAQIRAATNGGINTLSIIVVGPNSTNDTEHNRDAIWYEPQREIILQACRDYQCAYFDTYGMMPDVKNAAGFAMDNPFSNGQGVHPMNTMQTWIWGNVINTFFSAYATEKYRSNNFLNVPGAAGVPNAATVLTNYKKGTTMYRATVAAGWPFEGFVTIDRSADDVGSQRLAGFGSAASKSVQRTWNTTTGTWNSWTGTAVGLTIANGGTTTVTPEARVSDNGLVTISGIITGGTVAASTTILSGLPVFLRPTSEKRFAQCNTDGSHIAIGVNSSGNIFLVTAASAAGFHINLSYYI